MRNGPPTPDQDPLAFGTLDLELVRRYWRGETTAAEAEAVRHWLDAIPGRRAWYEQFRHALEHSDTPDLSAAEIARRRGAIMAAIGTSATNTAAATPGVGTARTTAGRTKRAQTPMISRMVRTSVTQRTRWSRPVMVVGACLATLLAIGTGMVVRRHANTTGSTERTYATAAGERATIQLPDGSSVILSADSKLRYRRPFEGAQRTVTVEGQAYFAVVADPTSPFVVNAAHAVAHVLGTSFVVRAYPRDSVVEVVVEEGKVALRPIAAPASSGTTLTRGDLGRIDVAGLATVAHNVSVDQYTSWTRGTLTFYNTPLRDVVQEMNRWYDVTIVLGDSSLAAATMTGTLPIHSAREAISDIAAAQHLRSVRHGQVVTLVPAER